METEVRYTIVVPFKGIDDKPYKVIVQLIYKDDDVEVLAFAYEKYSNVQPDISKYEIKKSNNIISDPVHYNLATRAIAYSEEYN